VVGEQLLDCWRLCACHVTWRSVLSHVHNGKSVILNTMGTVDLHPQEKDKPGPTPVQHRTLFSACVSTEALWQAMHAAGCPLSSARRQWHQGT
jgi:hypothetical protein